MEQKEPIIRFSPKFQGYLSHLDLLKSEATLKCCLPKLPSGEETGFFLVKSKDFLFVLFYSDDSLILQRNNVVSKISLKDVTSDKELNLFALWTHSEIGIYVKVEDEKNLRKSRVSTPPVTPPPELVKSARKKGLVPTIHYENVHEFRQRIHASIETISQRIGEADAYKSFWNFVYEGRRVKQRLPKREPEVQPLLKCFLSDQMLMAGIEMIPEAHSGAGDVDFLLIGNVQNTGMEKICMEVKLAHSPDLEHGLFDQLPEYMRYHNAAYGIYCVLNYKGEWFNEPQFPTNELLLHLDQRRREMQVPEDDRIRVFEINLSKPPTASQKK